MGFYKNVGNYPKTFYGITIEPGETKELPGYPFGNNIIEVDEVELPKKRRGRKPASATSTTTSPLINDEKASDDKDSSESEAVEDKDSKEKVS
jgi:hypothetical protein